MVGSFIPLYTREISKLLGHRWYRTQLTCFVSTVSDCYIHYAIRNPNFEEFLNYICFDKNAFVSTTRKKCNLLILGVLKIASCRLISISSIKGGFKIFHYNIFCWWRICLAIKTLTAEKNLTCCETTKGQEIRAGVRFGPGLELKSPGPNLNSQ